MYPEVSRAYWEAVHAVLTRKKTAKQAADELQVEVQRMLETPRVAMSSGSKLENSCTTGLTIGQLLASRASVSDAVRR